MVSIAGMLQHYRQAFDDHQARVLAEATVQIEADLRPAAVLCEVKTNISSHEVREFLEVFERVRPQLARDEKLDPADIHPLFFGYRASPDTRRLIADYGAWLAFPKGMIVPG